MKKKRPSLTTRLIVTMIGIVAGTVILCWFFNNTFLERYYIYNKQKELLNGYKQVFTRTMLPMIRILILRLRPSVPMAISIC